MKAIVQDRYGSTDVLRLDDIATPEPASDEVLVRVRAASVHPDIWHVVSGSPYMLRVMGSGFRRPKQVVPGTDVAGVVDAIGGEVTDFAAGDEVFGETLRGHQWQNGGGFAQYVAVRASSLAPKPQNITFEQAAAVPTSGLIAFQAVRSQGQVDEGQQVLVNGAGGGVGTFAVQIARAFGGHVTAVDSTDKLELLRDIGADHVVDYTTTDFTTGPQAYDLVVDIPGNHGFSAIRRIMRDDGRYVFIGHENFGHGTGRVFGSSVLRFVRLTAMAPFVSQQLINRPPDDAEDPMSGLTRLLASGDVVPVIDRTYSLAEVPDAIRYLQEGGVKGKVVISM